MGRISQPLVLVFLLCCVLQSAQGRYLFSDSKETPSASTREKRADSTIAVPGEYNVTVSLAEKLFPSADNRYTDPRCVTAGSHSSFPLLLTAQQIAALQEKLRVVQSSRDGAVKAQIAELRKQLQDKIDKLDVQTQDNSKLVLQITALQSELRGLKTEVAQATASEITDLKRQLAEKEKQLKTRNKQLEDKNAYNAKLILKINELENEIWRLQQNQSDPAQVAELQKELQDTISKLQEQNNDNSKLVLQIIALQSQVRELQKKAADPVIKAQIVQLQRELEEKTKKLEEKDKDNSELILQILGLQHEVEEHQRRAREQPTKERITDLQRQLEEESRRLKDRDKENSDLTRQIATLQDRVRQLEREVQNKIDELEAKTNKNFDQILRISTLESKVRELERAASQGTPGQIADLKRQLEEKDKQLKMRNKQLEDKNAYNAKLILKINELENELWEQHREQMNQTSTAQITELQNELQDKISQLQDKANDNSKLVLQIIALQSQVRELQKKAADPVIKAQIVQLQKQLEEKTSKLEEKDKDNSKLILQILSLQNEVKEQQRRNTDMVAKEQITELQRQLRDKEEECSSLQQRYDVLHDQLTSKFAEVSKLQGELADKEAENSRLEELREQLVAKTKNCSKLQSQYDELLKQQGKCEGMEELQKQLSARDAEISRQLKEKDSDISKLERRLRDKESESSRLERELRDKEDDYSRLQRRYNELQGKTEEVEDTKIRAAVVTLDGSTAHPKLSLSRDGREVTVVFQEKVYPFIMTCEDSDVSEPPLILTHVGTSLSWLG
ncbi:hypothetical protein MATL_G00252130 [Megalops atlanticus]|uniref:Uncharacterized protein n=1 Tax=Megalops atlanticus TaxID=7932 RepID=A0A9D3P9B8_MEGAT|nr:hypothetical protein MATL_G00252130 [Megalops atlanticus]